MQSLSVNILAASSVHIIPGKRMPYVGKMHPDLVSSSRLRTHLHERIAFSGSQPYIISYRRLTVLTNAAKYDRLALSCNGSVYRAALLGNAVNCRKIDLFAVSLKQVCGMSILCGYAQSRGIAVKPVHGTKGQLRVAVRKIIPQRIALMLYRGMYGHPSRLVKDHKAFVFKSYRNVQAAVRLEEACILGTQDDLIPRKDNINAADRLVVPRNTAIYPFKLRQQPP